MPAQKTLPCNLIMAVMMKHGAAILRVGWWCWNELRVEPRVQGAPLFPTAQDDHRVQPQEQEEDIVLSNKHQPHVGED